jgi:hypothetical protein
MPRNWPGLLDLPTRWTTVPVLWHELRLASAAATVVLELSLFAGEAVIISILLPPFNLFPWPSEILLEE